VRDAPLLSDLRARPDDDGRREVYSDWLLERGDPRGEFIALQASSRSRLPFQTT
jgi:uncharacterized protein (TIGR02996 family)